MCFTNDNYFRDEEDAFNELELSIAKKLWDYFDEHRCMGELDIFDTFRELIEEVAEQNVHLLPAGSFWASRRDSTAPFGPGNLKIQSLVYDADKAKMIAPAFEVSGYTPLCPN